MQLREGRIYRTKELRRWSANPTRLAERLVADGKLVPLRKGLYHCPRQSSWGVVPPEREEILRAALDGAPFLISGSSTWNALGLGSTAVFATPLVYNTKFSGEREIAGRRFYFRRVRFPRKPSREWHVVDLIEHRLEAGVDLASVLQNLSAALRAGRFDASRLMAMASAYGTRATMAAIHGVIQASAPIQ